MPYVAPLLPKQRILNAARALIIAVETNNDTLFHNNLHFISAAIIEYNTKPNDLPFG